MEKLAPTLLAFPAGASSNSLVMNEVFDEAVKNHAARLSRLLKDHSSELITHGPQLLELLNPELNSMSYLAVLHTLLIPGVANSAPLDFLLQKLVTFLLQYEPLQCRYAGTYLQDIFLRAVDGNLLPPSVAVAAVAEALNRLDPTGSMLTVTHIHLARLAYNTNNIEAALPVIDKNIVFFPGMAGHFNPDYLCEPSLPPPAYISRESGLTGTLKPALVMEYEMLRGMMYCALRDWSKAFAAFQRVVTYPTREGGTSKIMIEAYKKWVLVSLLSKGKLAETPSNTPAASAKLYANLAKPYTSVAVAFVADDAQVLKAEVEKNTAIWLEDANTGLVKEVLSAYQKWRVLALEQIYSNISLSEIRQQTTSAETGEKLQKDEDVETLIQNMIISGMLSGVIEKNDDGTKYLSFLSLTTPFTEVEFVDRVKNTASQLMQLQNYFKITKERLGTNKEYLKHVIKEEKRAADKSNDPEPVPDFDATVDDEDLMGGIMNT